MVNHILVVKAEHCTGCRICEQWCSVHHFNVVQPSRARLLIHHQPPQTHYPAVCQHCEDASCIAVCPVEALAFDEQTGGLVLDEALCIACRACADICTHDVLRFDDGLDLPLPCDLCGGSPQCAAHCAEGAIQWVTG